MPIGLALVVGLVAVGGWVAYKGAHPDPSLLALDVVPAGDKSATANEAAEQPEGRGPFPEGLAAEGYKESSVRSYDPDTLYVKINGRAGYYRSFGVEKLFFMTLEKIDDPTTIVDLELYDHGKVDNALGAYNGERGSDSQPQVGDKGLWHYARNAMYLTLGRYYLRAVGSDESPAIRAQLEKVQARFEAEVNGEPLPWAYGLFIGKMGFKPGALSFYPENAFNFSFAKDVNVARLDDETELFVVAVADEEQARAQAQRFMTGFQEYGADKGQGWIEDRYIQTIATARAKARWLYGVRGAPNLKAAEAGLARIEAGLDGFEMPAAAPPASDPSDEDPPGENEAEAADAPAADDYSE